MVRTPPCTAACWDEQNCDNHPRVGPKHPRVGPNHPCVCQAHKAHWRNLPNLVYQALLDEQPRKQEKWFFNPVLFANVSTELNSLRNHFVIREMVAMLIGRCAGLNLRSSLRQTDSPLRAWFSLKWATWC